MFQGHRHSRKVKPNGKEFVLDLAGVQGQRFLWQETHRRQKAKLIGYARYGLVIAQRLRQLLSELLQARLPDKRVARAGDQSLVLVNRGEVFGFFSLYNVADIRNQRAPAFWFSAGPDYRITIDKFRQAIAIKANESNGQTDFLPGQRCARVTAVHLGFKDGVGELITPL